VLIIQLVLW